jgi:hypothetical protein
MKKSKKDDHCNVPFSALNKICWKNRFSYSIDEVALWFIAKCNLKIKSNKCPKT